ncbi:MAG: cyclase [Verrucomicrobia bacterium]|nr:cyclase [Verrucomicrobiota bacterium]
MRIFDITVPITNDMPVWPGDPKVEIEQIDSIDKGSNANVSRICAGVHSGTHVDAPHHFLNNHKGIDTVPLELLTGSVFVLHVADSVYAVNAEVINTAAIPEGTRRLLLRTRNSDFWAGGVKEFQQNFTGVTADGAEALIQKGIKLIGVDYLSVGPYKQGKPTHKAFMGAGVTIVEGLNLAEVPQGQYTLYCLPLKIVGADGAPARAILVQR